MRKTMHELLVGWKQVVASLLLFSLWIFGMSCVMGGERTSGRPRLPLGTCDEDEYRESLGRDPAYDENWMREKSSNPSKDAMVDDAYEEDIRYHDRLARLTPRQKRVWQLVQEIERRLEEIKRLEGIPE